MQLIKCQILGLELRWGAASCAKHPGADRHKGKSTDSVQAQLPGAAPAPPLLPTGLSCRKRIELQRAAPPRGLHGPGRAGNELALGLKSEQEQSHVAASTQVTTSAEYPDSPAPFWPHCDRSPLCLNRLLGQGIGPPNTAGCQDQQACFLVL